MTPEPDCDLLVVGAGIHGAGVAQAAAAAGYGVRLVECGDAPALGTSGRSSGLIHGGLRYLQNGQLRLVRECLRERALLLRLAPGLVRLTPFHLPVYAGARPGAWAVGAGLMAYGLLAAGGVGGGFRRLPRREWGTLDGLDSTGLRAVYRYRDAQTDDAALTGAVLASARALGAEVQFGTRLLEARVSAQGVLARCAGSAGEITIRARAVANAAGPWAHRLAQRFSPPLPLPAVRLVAGSHVLLPGRVQAGAYTLTAPDGRVVFVLPHAAGVLVGTTEVDFHGDPAGVVPGELEIEYLRSVFARAFPAHPAVGAAPLDCFAGVRVLPAGGSAHGASRESVLASDSSGRVLTVLGGKLTAYRATAERVLARLAAVLPPRPARADTRRLPLPP